MIQNLKDNFNDAFYSIIPIVAIVIILSVFIPIPTSLLIGFLISTLIIIIGTGLFTFGADISMVLIGESIGNKLVKSKKLLLILIISFIIGTIVTIAEPDLRIFAIQVPSIPTTPLILIISIGVGISLLLASLRSIYGWSLNKLLMLSYSIALILIFFVNEKFVPMAFDSGGATTGTISIPFIMTLGLGLAANRIDKNAKEASFGLVALCSVGPIIAVLLLGLFFNLNNSAEMTTVIKETLTINDYLNQLLISIKDVLFSLAPIIVVFLIFQVITKTFSKTEMRKIILGLVFTLVGLTLFFMAANVGFIDMGHFLGEYAANSNLKYILIPFTMIIAYFIAIAEPAVQILNEQIEKITEGSISKKTMDVGVALGVSIATGLGIIKIFTNTPFIYYLIPLQILSLVLMFFTPKVFTAIAFDLGGATGGTLTSAFILPIAIGICLATDTDVLSHAFGIPAFISLAPLITIQVIGIIYQYKHNRKVVITDIDDSIIDFE